MNTRDTAYGKYRDNNGEEYYCPVNEGIGGRVVTDREIDNCVEVSTVGRYSGNLEVKDRFTT